MGQGGRFVGRSRDLAALAQLEAQGERLITIHGPAGMGKTRLAREYARRVEEEKAIFLVDLASARSFEDVGLAVSAAFELPTTHFASAAHALASAARVLEERGPALVLLDNLEHLVDCAVDVLEPLLAARGATVLVTSRETLRVGGEAVLALEPLSLAGGEGEAPSEALELLLDRVRRCGAVDVDVPACADIARALDGIPLALELAAPRVGLLGAAAFRERLARPLDELTHAPRDAARHQRSLRGAIDGSWVLLEPTERAALADCSLFRGSFTLEAFGAVVAVDSSRTAVEMLQSLHDKSLVRRLVAGGGAAARFSLYLSIREYAAEKLAQDPGALAAARRRYVLFHLERGEALAEDITTVRAADVLDALGADRDELLAIVDLALEDPAGASLEHGARALLVLGDLYLARGPLPPFLTLLARFESVAEANGLSSALLAELHVLRGRAAHSRGQFDAACDAYTLARTLAKRIGSVELEARAFGGLAASESRRNASEEALRLFTESAALHRALGDDRREGIALRRESVSLRELGRLDEAYVVASRSAELLQASGDATYEALALTELGYIALEAGDLAVARAKGEQGERLATLTGHWLNKSLIDGYLGLVALAEGNLDEATARLSHGVAGRAHQVGPARYEGQAVGYLGVALLERGEVERAIEQIEIAVALLAGETERRCRIPFQAFLAAALAARGDVERAVELARDAASLVGQTDHRQHAVEVLAAVVLVTQAAEGGVLVPSMPAVAEASRVLAAASHHASPGKAAFDLRLALRHARHALARLGLAPPIGSPPTTMVTVDGDGEWFEVAGNTRTSLRRRPTLRLLLLELTRARIASPGRPVEVSRLLAAVWPNEQVVPHAAKNRVAVSISTLRKLGLRDLLASDARGYFLDPTVAFVWADRIEAPVPPTTTPA